MFNENRNEISQNVVPQTERGTERILPQNTAEIGGTGEPAPGYDGGGTGGFSEPDSNGREISPFPGGVALPSVNGQNGDSDYNEGDYDAPDGIGEGETNQGSSDYTGTGYLTVAVRAADGAIPLEGALVTLRRGTDAIGQGDGIASFTTDRSGLTPRIYLAAPPRSNSDEPGGPRAYATYSVEVSLPGYHSNVYTDIPVFDGITSVQTAILIPLPEDGAEGGSVPDKVNIFSREYDGGPDGGTR